MKKYTLINRDQDIITNNRDLETLYTYKQFPVFMGCVEHDFSEDLFENMSWNISKTSGMIQLNPLLPLDVVYPMGHGSGTTGKLWNDHHLAFAKFISTHNPKSVLEIGGCHGILAQKYLEFNENPSWTIIEPNPCVPSNIPVKVIKGFFDNKFTSDQKYDTIVHSHVLEHIYDINKFLIHISSFANDKSLMLFSIPNMNVMIERGYTNCINFEHTTLLTEPYVECLLARNKFEVIEKLYFMEDHSIFYCAKKVSKVPQKPLPENLYDRNKHMFLSYINYHKKNVERMNTSIEMSNRPIYLFGAHIFSQYLFSYGLKPDRIISILDNDSRKQGKRLYGINLKVESPKSANRLDGSSVILSAGVYNEEIKKDILQNITENVVFIE